MKIMSAAKNKIKETSRKAAIGVWDLTNPASVKGQQDYCTASPDYIFGVYIGNCCKRHDEDYQNRKGDWTKDKAIRSHKRLRNCIRKTLILAGKVPFLAKCVAGIYYRCVRMFSRMF